MEASSKLSLIDQGNLSTEFYSNHVFHERQMNSCPIGCVGCAVSAKNSVSGSMAYADILSFYQQAKSHKVSLKISKVEGYDPVFVTYKDSPDTAFAQSIVDALDLGHQIISPICTTGSWKSERSKWQLKELGLLTNKYRQYKYPSGNSGLGFVLSVPREIRPFANANYDFDWHLNKILEDIQLLTMGGDIEVLIYFNNLIDGDYEFASMLRSQTEIKLEAKAKSRARLLLTNFNSQTIPESCYRYSNSILFSDQGFTPIDLETMDWSLASTQDTKLWARHN